MFHPPFIFWGFPMHVHVPYLETTTGCEGAEKVLVSTTSRPWTWWIRLDLHGEYCDVTITLMPSARPFVANDFPVLQLSQDGAEGGKAISAKRPVFGGLLEMLKGWDGTELSGKIRYYAMMIELLRIYIYIYVYLSMIITYMHIYVCVSYNQCVSCSHLNILMAFLEKNLQNCDGCFFLSLLKSCNLESRLTIIHIK